MVPITAGSAGCLILVALACLCYRRSKQDVAEQAAGHPGNDAPLLSAEDGRAQTKLAPDLDSERIAQIIAKHKKKHEVESEQEPVTTVFEPDKLPEGFSSEPRRRSS